MGKILDGLFTFIAILLVIVGALMGAVGWAIGHYLL